MHFAQSKNPGRLFNSVAISDTKKTARPRKATARLKRKRILRIRIFELLRFASLCTAFTDKKAGHRRCG